jgi:hypothetical protein
MQLQRAQIGRVAAIAMLALVTLPAAAALYKWTDANGRVVYSDQPPTGVNAERISGAAPPSNPNAMRELAQKDADINKRQQQRAEAAANDEKADAETKKKFERCAQMRGQIKSLQQDLAVYRYDDKGQKVYLDTYARQKSIADNEKVLRDLNCAGANG